MMNLWNVIDVKALTCPLWNPMLLLFFSFLHLLFHSLFISFFLSILLYYVLFIIFHYLYSPSQPRFSLVNVLLLFNTSLIILAPSSPIPFPVYFFVLTILLHYVLFIFFHCSYSPSPLRFSSVSEFLMILLHAIFALIQPYSSSPIPFPGYFLFLSILLYRVLFLLFHLYILLYYSNSVWLTYYYFSDLHLSF